MIEQARQVQERVTSQPTDVGRRVCVVGLGRQGFDLAEQLLSSQVGWRLAAVVDRSVASYARFQASFYDKHVPFFRSLSQALTHRRVDVVIIATTAPSHVALALEAIDAGHEGVMLVEKPISNSLIEANRLQTYITQKAWPGKVGLGFYRRCSDIYRQVEKALNSGELGSLRRIEFNRSGQISMRGSHYVDLATWLTKSRPARVVCQLQSEGQKDHRGAFFYDPPGHMRVFYKNGVEFALDMRKGNSSYTPGMTFFCERGQVFVDEPEFRVEVRRPNAESAVYQSSEPSWHARHYQWFENTLNAMLGLNGYPFCDLDDARNCLEVITAAHLSDAEQGESIELPLSPVQARHSLRVA